MYREGVVVNLDEGMVELAVSRISACSGGCKTCSGCDTPQLFVSLPNKLNAKLGDRVRLKADNKKIFSYAFLVFVIPVILLVATIALSYRELMARGIGQAELLSFGLGLLVLVIAGLAIRLVDKKLVKSESSLVVMDKILGNIIE